MNMQRDGDPFPMSDDKISNITSFQNMTTYGAISIVDEHRSMQEDNLLIIVIFSMLGP